MSPMHAATLEVEDMATNQLNHKDAHVRHVAKAYLDLLKRHEALVKAAKDVHSSLHRVYHGYPSKMDWIEIHVLRQMLEQIDSEQA